MIKKYVLELQPDSYAVVVNALSWYHESLHMITDPEKYDPELPLEQLSDRDKRVHIIKSHRLISQFGETHD